MYIGSPKSDAGSPKSDAKWNAEAINGSYAAEAEGQTVVRGDLLARPIKTGSDGKSFFTLGMVAFGAQYLPAAGTTILAVGGKVGSNPGAISTLGGGDTDHAQAWNAPVGIKSKATNTSKEYDYKAYIAGKQSTVWGDPATPSVRAYRTPRPTPSHGAAPRGLPAVVLSVRLKNKATSPACLRTFRL